MILIHKSYCGHYLKVPLSCVELILDHHHKHLLPCGLILPHFHHVSCIHEFKRNNRTIKMETPRDILSFRFLYQILIYFWLLQKSIGKKMRSPFMKISLNFYIMSFGKEKVQSIYNRFGCGRENA